MSHNVSVFDVEDHLDNHIVRKNVAKERTNEARNAGPKVHENIPLTLAHLNRATRDPDREDVFVVSDIHFRTCILYALAVGHGTHNASFQKFWLDDSTGTLEASFPKKSQKRQALVHLANEVNSLSSYEGYREISQSLKRLLSATNTFTDPSTIQKGSHLCLLGRPNFFRNTIGFDVFSFFIDAKGSRSLEIGFADHLIEWHTKKRQEGLLAV
ncbi:hypothetical protein KR018_009438 [Drosophila ironensis]|nr:hypothetical protein KR018_009438 [Drosophila ironensis]